MALIVGASGLIGHHLLMKLLASSTYSKVIVLVRETLTISHPKLIQWQVNFQQLSTQLTGLEGVQLEVRSNTGSDKQLDSQRGSHSGIQFTNAFDTQAEKLASTNSTHSTHSSHQKAVAMHDISRVDDVFCTLGSTIKKAGSKAAFTEVDYHYPLIIAQHFYQQQASLFAIVTAMGANASSPLFYNHVKGKIEASLRAIGYQHLGIFRPSMLSGQRHEFRLGEKIGAMCMHALAFIIPKQYQVIEAKKVASAMLDFANKRPLGVSVIRSDQLQNH